LKNTTRVVADKIKQGKATTGACEKVSTFSNQSKWGYFILSFKVHFG